MSVRVALVESLDDYSAGCLIRDKGATYLRKLKKLKTLSVGGNRISTPCFVRVVVSLKSVQHSAGVSKRLVT